MVHLVAGLESSGGLLVRGAGVGEYSDGYIFARDIAAVLLWTCGKGSLDKDTSSTSTSMEGYSVDVV